MTRQLNNTLTLYTVNQFQRFKGNFFLSGFVTKVDEQKNLYAEIHISDATGTQILYCRDNSCINGNIQPNSLVYIEARLEMKGKRPYMSCKNISPCSAGPFFFRHLLQLPVCLCNKATSLNQLIALVDSIQSSELKVFVTEVILQPNVALKFITCPASIKYHHNYAGGLLDHSVEVATSFASSKPSRSVQHDLAVVAGLLHDVGKTQTLTSDLTLTDVGMMLEHDALTVEICANALAKLSEQNAWLANQLRHAWTCATPGSRYGLKPKTLLAKQLQQHDRDSAFNNEFNPTNTTN
jgi:3'-5' exoribonuclease